MFSHLLRLVKENSFFYTAYLVFLIGGLWGTMNWGKDSLFLYLNNLHHPFADQLGPWLTHLGDGLFAVLFLLIFLMINYRLALTAFVCFAAVLLLTQLGKLVLFEDALRPLAYFEVKGINIRTVDGVKVHAHNSFPSGHSASAFALFSFFALQLRDKKWGLPLLLAAILIAYTRIYIAQHFLEDVLAGSVIGILTVLILTAYLNAYFDKRPANWHRKGLFVK